MVVCSEWGPNYANRSEHTGEWAPMFGPFTGVTPL